jgi:membrane protein
VLRDERPKPREAEHLALRVVGLYKAVAVEEDAIASQSFRVVTPGAVLAVIVWVFASLGFSWYVSNFASYNATYGALATVIVLLFYFFISAAILLFGAELNSQVYHQAAEEENTGERRI